MISSTTNMVPPLRNYSKFPKQGTKTHYEVSEATGTYHYNGYTDTEHTKDKGALYAIKDVNSLEKGKHESNI